MDAYLPWAVLVIFTIAHVLSKWAEAREKDTNITISAYLTQIAPAKTPLAIITAIGLGLVMQEQEVFNSLTALTSGWASSSALDNLQKRGASMLGGG